MIVSTDASQRYIRAKSDPLVRNLAALWAWDPALARAVEALPDEPVYRTQPSQAGPPTVLVPSQGREICLHSRYKPVEEAERLLDGLDFDEQVAFYVYGLGLGYHVGMLLEWASSDAIIVVFEPDLLMLRTAMEHRDLTAIFESRRVIFLTKPDKAELFVRLTPHAAVLALGAGTVTHAPSVRLHPEFHQQMAVWVDEFTAYTRTSINTLVANGRRTLENIAHNLAWYVTTPSLSLLKDGYKQSPAVIVSAGPSLRKNQHLLKGLEDRAVIIAVQTTLQPLLEMGVTPHFVTSLDYHDICTRYFEKLPPNLPTQLVAEPKASSAIFSVNPGPLWLNGNDMAESLLREMKIGKEKLPAGCTVAHLAYYLAEHLGCDPIIFVGQDLGFSDGLFYTPGTSIEDVWRPELGRFCTMEMKQWEHIARDRPILRQIPDQENRPMYTEGRLYTYLQQFERDFLRSGRRIIDASEGGARKRGATPMRLAEAIERFCTASLPAEAVERSAPMEDWRESALSSLSLRRQEAKQIEQISRETRPLLEEVRDHLGDQARVNRAIARIDLLRNRMNQYGPTYDLVMQLSQRTELERFHADRRISASRADGAERQRRQVQRDVENVRAVIEAAEAFGRLMDQVSASLQSQASAGRTR
jgi:hypothetical protein